MFRLYYAVDYFNKLQYFDITEERLNELETSGRLDLERKTFHAIIVESYDSGYTRIIHEPYCPYFLTDIQKAEEK